LKKYHNHITLSPILLKFLNEQRLFWLEQYENEYKLRLEQIDKKKEKKKEKKEKKKQKINEEIILKLNNLMEKINTVEKKK